MGEVNTHMPAMSVTADVFQSPMGWSKTAAPKNLTNEKAITEPTV